MRRYCDFYTKRRIMDRAVRNIKYNDGIRDILNKMKLKITEFIRLTQNDPKYRKISAYLSSAVAVAFAINSARTFVDLSNSYKELKKISSNVKTAYYSVVPKETRDDIMFKKFILIISLINTYLYATDAICKFAKKQIDNGEDESRVIADVITR